MAARKTYTAGELRALARGYAQKYKVPYSLVLAIMWAESQFNQEARSPAGAIGAMQLMPGTAAGLGVDPYDGRQNVEGGVKYLKQMLDRFKGDQSRAIAAYNAGPGAVAQYGGVPPYKETKAYVSKVTAKEAEYAKSGGSTTTSKPQKNKWSPLRDEIVAYASSRGFKVSSERRSYDTVKGPGTSDHYDNPKDPSTQDSWAVDLVPTNGGSQRDIIRKCEDFEVEVKTKFRGRYKQVLGPLSDPAGHGGSNAHVHFAGHSQAGGNATVGLGPEDILKVPGVKDGLGAAAGAAGTISDIGGALGAGLEYAADAMRESLSDMAWTLVQGVLVLTLVGGGVGVVIYGLVKASGTEQIVLGAVTKGATSGSA